MDYYVATMVTADGDYFEVCVGEVGWSLETLGTVEGGGGMFDRAEELLAARYGWRPVGGESWVAVPGSNDCMFIVAVER